PVAGNVITEDTGNGVDSDPDVNGQAADDVLEVSAVNGNQADVGQPIVLPSGATLKVSADGSFNYDPSTSSTLNALPAGAPANDSFTYTISDGHGGVDTALVMIALTGVNDVAAAVDDMFTANEDEPFDTGNVLANDSDADNDTLVVSAVNGAATSVGQEITLTSGALLKVSADGTFRYDPRPVAVFNALSVNETAVDMFSYTIADGAGGTSTAMVMMTVEGRNDDPLATGNTAAVVEDDQLTDTGNLLTDDDGSGTDSDIDQNQLTPDDVLVVASVAGSTNAAADVAGLYGMLAWSVDGSHMYMLNNTNADVQGLAVGEILTDKFDYVVSDGNGGVDTATLVVTITGTNDAPFVTNSPADRATDIGDLFRANLAMYFDDIDVNDVLSFSAEQGDGSPLPSWLNVENGILSGRPADVDLGRVDIRIIANDGHGGIASDVFQLLVTVGANNTAPTITSPNSGMMTTVVIPENTTFVEQVIAMDPDLHVNPFTFSLRVTGGGGADVQLFHVDPTSGVLTFRSPPDFELPADQGGNNFYEVIVYVEDEKGGVDFQVFQVQVTDVLEPNKYSFSERAYSVLEEDVAFATNTVLLVRSGNANIASNVTVFLTGGSNDGNNPGVDFIDDPITIHFGIDETTKAVPITILGDTTIEDNGPIMLRLANFSNGGLPGEIATSVLTIEDDDGPLNVVNVAGLVAADNEDPRFQPTALGLPSVPVALREVDAQGNPIEDDPFMATTTTVDNGTYAFRDVPAGYYEVLIPEIGAFQAGGQQRRFIALPRNTVLIGVNFAEEWFRAEYISTNVLVASAMQLGPPEWGWRQGLKEKVVDTLMANWP
ncbi:MAG: VCBS domain-containing protein, partial [Planctomycetales bacterium]|nr:VCBS domain-containing protein [Planctomycetales bacterium]